MDASGTETILGIDLGTTNSVVSIIRDGESVVLREDGEAVLPSVVGLDTEGNLLVGMPAHNQWTLAPERTVRSIKRKMGEETAVKLGDQKYSPQEISAMILRTLKERAQKQLGQPVRKAVITVPAFFNENQREATREAGELAGLDVVRIINEPTAAALIYEAGSDQMERLLVYDLGGGTFDVSIVQVEKGVVEVLSSHGDTQLGGDDFDKLLLDFVCDRFAEEHQIDLRASAAPKSRTLRAVEEAKRKLSFEPFATIEEEFIAEKDGMPLHLKTEVSRVEYEGLIEPLLTKTLERLDETLTDAKLQVNQIDKIILVGGSSRTPMVHQLLQERLGQEVHLEVDPDLCVAMGAAVQGALIQGIDVGAVLVDITPHTLGIQTLGQLQGFVSANHFSPIIEKNTPLPASRTDVYGTVHDGQDQASISVFQGEDEDVRHNQPVGDFVLDELSDARRGNQITVRFDLDLDGILNVTATERATGREKRLTIDNAITRFRASNREEALQRLNVMFGSDDEGGDGNGAETQAADSDLPEELREAIAEAQQLIAKGESLLPDAGPEDAEEIRELVRELRDGIDIRSQAKIRQFKPQLEDIVFYLQDA